MGWAGDVERKQGRYQDRGDLPGLPVHQVLPDHLVDSPKVPEAPEDLKDPVGPCLDQYRLRGRSGRGQGTQEGLEDQPLRRTLRPPRR